MDPDEGTGFDDDREFAADVLANILMRLPANTRRLFRLVCRHWRDVVGTRTATNLRSRAKTLVANTGYAYVVDDLSSPDSWTGRHCPSGRELWKKPGNSTAGLYENMNVVGTINGLVCLCDTGGGITVANPVTGEALDVPPLPLQATTYSRSWREGYGFAYLPASRRYKVVHVPCWVNGSAFGTVRVIALGEASWRDVPAEPSVKSYNGYGIVSVDGSVYWAAKSERTEKVMWLNLEDEMVAPITSSLPSVLSDSKDVKAWHLAEVHGRLGIVASRHVSSTTEVWVMERGEWNRWYTVRFSTPPPRSQRRCLTWPLFVHGEHVLAWEPELHGQGSVLYRHTLIPEDDQREARRGDVVDIGDTALWWEVGRYLDMTSYMSYRRTFAYVKTKEPLNVYRYWVRCDDLMSGLHYQLMYDYLCLVWQSGL